MPMYNAEKTVAGAIESILSQTYKNLRLIIVDDSSTDSSLKIAKKYLLDSRVSIYKNNINMGAYYCRNFGLSVVSLKNWGYFTTHDADDISFPNRYSMIIRTLSNKTKCLGIQDKFERIDLNTNKSINVSLTMAHAVFKRQVFDIVGYFETARFGADWEHWYRLSTYAKLNNYTTGQMPEIMGISYIHDTNLTVLIPLKSPKRLKYVSTSKKNIEKMIENNNFKRIFVPIPDLTVRIVK